MRRWRCPCSSSPSRSACCSPSGSPRLGSLPSAAVLDLRVASRRGEFELDVAFQAPAGATTVIVGESGAGKTSILRLAAGLDAPSGGRIALDDDVYADPGAGIVVPPWRREVGYVAQDYALFPHLTVAENVAFGLRATGVSRKDVQSRVAESL